MQPQRFLIYHREGHHISMSAEDLALLGGDISVAKRIPTSDRDHGYDVRTVRRSLLVGDNPSQSLEPDESWVNAGLIDVLIYRAAKRRIWLSENAETPTAVLTAPILSPQLEYPAVPLFVHRLARGLIRIPKNFDVAILIAELAVAYPTKRIMLLGNVTELKPIWDELKRILPQSMIKKRRLVFVHSRRPLELGEDDIVPRLICCTPIAAATLDSEKCDIVIVYDAFACLHKSMQWPLIQQDLRFRLIGLQRANGVAKPYEQARLAQVFGFATLDLSTSGRVRRDVQLAWVRCGGVAPDDAVQIEPVTGRPQGRETVNQAAAFVHNHARNDLICRLAKSFRNGVPVEGERLKDVRNWLNGRDYRPQSVTVVVSDLDHALQIGRRLAAWPIIAGKCNLHGFSRNVRQRIEMRPGQWLPCAIVVASAAQQYPGYHSDVVILASGGVSSKEVPAFWLYAIRNPGRPLLVVDFLDDFTGVTRKWSFQRRECFAQRDIFRVGISPVMGRVQRFLALTGNPS